MKYRYFPRLLMSVFIFSVLTAYLPALHAQTVNFEFDNADLRTVIKAVAEFTGKNFLVDPNVKGKVTVVAPEPLTREEAYKTFLSVLEVHGYMAVESGGVIKIVPEEQGKTREAVPYTGKTMPDRDDMVTRVIHLDPILRSCEFKSVHQGVRL